MNEYRVDVICDAGREPVTLEQEFFEASSDDRAFAKAHRIVARHVTGTANTGSVFGELFRRASGGSLQADYVDVVEPEDGAG